MMDVALSANTPLLQLTPSPNSEQDDLSEAQLHQLLKSAESRLKSSLDKSLDLASTHILTAALGVQKSLSAGSRGGLPSPYIHFANQYGHLDPVSNSTVTERRLANEARNLDDPVLVKSKLLKAEAETAGADWYDIPRTKLTPELKRDLQLLRMRSVLDPKRHYKKESVKNQVPQFSVVGSIIEGPTEFFNARLTRQERKRTFVEEVLAGERATNRFKSKYKAIQLAKTSGKKAHCRAIRAKRTRKAPNG